MGAGGTATRRQPQPRRLRRSDRPRVTRRRRRPSGLAAYRRRPRDTGTAAVTDPLRGILRRIVAAAPGPSAIVNRAAALAGNRDGLVPAAAALHAAGCRYQWARTLVFIGDTERARGQSALAAMGATPMAVMAVPAVHLAAGGVR